VITAYKSKILKSVDYEMEMKDQPAFCFFQIKIMQLRDNPIEFNELDESSNDPEIMV
jgi:hypothetical protein